MRGILEFPRDFARPDGARPTWSRCAPPAGSVRGCSRRRSGWPVGWRCPGTIDAAAREAFLSPRRRGRCRSVTDGWRSRRTRPSARRPSTSPTCCGAPTSRTASPGTRWPCSCARDAPRSPACDGRSVPPASRSRWPATTCRSSATRPCCRCSTRCAPCSTSTTTTATTSSTSTRAAPRRCSPVRSAGSTPATCAGSPASCASGRRRAPTRPARLPRPSRELLRAAVVEPGFLDGLVGAGGRPGPARCTRCSSGRAPSSTTAPPPSSCSGRCGPAPRWPQRLRRSVAAGGGAARRANRDLDSLVALFDAAARAEEQRDHVGRAQLPGHARGAADPRRHALRARGAWRRGAAADRPPLQGPGVAARRGGPRPGRGVARPAPPLDAAPGRPDRQRRAGATGHRRASCCWRSGGCSTSRARAPASGSW